ncbi:MAG: poly(ADP-ribose) glycohydrolase [Myxococcota bacterium]|nr:poly(ADP-ribose) glycohydrolase [Myxococcota bacterium]
MSEEKETKTLMVLRKKDSAIQIFTPETLSDISLPIVFREETYLFKGKRLESGGLDIGESVLFVEEYDGRPLSSRLTQCPKTPEDWIGRLQFHSFPVDSKSILSFWNERRKQFDRLVPFLWAEACALDTFYFPLHIAKKITLTQRECLRILANGFFCSFSRDSYHWNDYPSINWDRLYARLGSVEYAKLSMFWDYFSRSYERIQNGDSLQNILQFSLLEGGLSKAEWLQSDKRLASVTMQAPMTSIDGARHAWRADFANRYLGGASLSHGCVQEEILFSICPELNVGRLFSRYMRPNEAIAMVGAEQFAVPQGYGWSFSNGGVHQDSTPVQEGVLQSFLVALDACDYRRRDPRSQYQEVDILRDVNKAYIAFGAPFGPRIVATGNWGCGVFGGNPALKLLLQWMAVSQSNRSLLYYPWEQRPLCERVPVIVQKAIDKGIRVREMAHFLFHILEPGTDVLTQFTRFLEE